MTARRHLAVAFAALSLAACETAPAWLDVAPDQVWNLAESAPVAGYPMVVEGRPAEDRLHRTEPLAIHVGDDHIQPAPIAAVAGAIAARLAKPAQRAHLDAMSAGAPLVLKQLEITIVARNVNTVGGSGVRELAQRIGGGSNVDVIVTVGLGDRVFSGRAHGNLTASPSVFSIHRLFGEAMDKIADAISASTP
jgi:hypothetical protein